MSGAVRCLKPTCRAVYAVTTDGAGRVVGDCPRCARKRAGVCRDCPNRTASTRHVRCTSCARARKLERNRVRDRERYPKRRRHVIARLKRARRNPVVAEHRRRYMAAYRAANPRDDQDRAYQRVYMRQRRSDPAFRERQNARKRELRALRKQQQRAAA